MTLTLYAYFRSSCSARVRTAALLKGLTFEQVVVNTANPNGTPEEFRKINPSMTVPALLVQEDGKEYLIRQSNAILEYFEEVYPDPPLLPKDPLERAKVRELVSIIIVDVQPLNGTRLMRHLEKHFNERDFLLWGWDRGLRAFDSLIGSYGGKYCIGDAITMADVVLAPAVENALNEGYDMDQIPNIKRVYGTLKDMDVFKKGSWRAQPDTPEEFRI